MPVAELVAGNPEECRLVEIRGVRVAARHA